MAGNTLKGTRLEFTYDGLSRRTSKKTTRFVGVTVDSVAMEGYLYDGWNVVMISQLDPLNGNPVTRKWSGVWKPDVGRLPYALTSWQRAGGVGGLAWLQTGIAQTLGSSYQAHDTAAKTPSFVLGCYRINFNAGTRKITSRSTGEVAHEPTELFNKTISKHRTGK